MASMTIKSVLRGSLTCKMLGVHHQPLDVEPGTGTSFPVAFSRLHCVVVVAGSAIIASTILDNTTAKHPPHCHTIHFYASVISLESNNRTRENPYSARAATRATPPCALSLPSTRGSALTPTALPILLKSRLYATLYEAFLDLIFNNPRARAGKSPQELSLDMLSGQ